MGKSNMISNKGLFSTDQTWQRDVRDKYGYIIYKNNDPKNELIAIELIPTDTGKKIWAYTQDSASGLKLSALFSSNQLPVGRGMTVRGDDTLLVSSECALEEGDDYSLFKFVSVLQQFSKFSSLLENDIKKDLNNLHAIYKKNRKK